MSLVKSCSQCTRSAQNGDYCNYFNRRTLTRGEAIICDRYAVTGEVVIGPIGSLSGFLVLAQIPDALITGAKIADNTISTLKIQDSAITADKIAAGAVEAAEIADLVITNAKISATAGIVESKLTLDFSTASLNTAIGLRQLSSEKNAANGYCGLDASTYVPLARLANIANTQIAAGAGIVESKLTLNFATHDNASDHARSHTVPSGSDHSGTGLTIGNVLRVSGASAFGWAQLALADISGHTKAVHDALAINADFVDSVHVAALTNTRLLRYNSTGTQIENATVVESAGALSAITTIDCSGNVVSSGGNITASAGGLTAGAGWAKIGTGAVGSCHGYIYNQTANDLYFADHNADHTASCGSSTSVSIYNGYYKTWTQSSAAATKNIIGPADPTELEKQFNSLNVKVFVLKDDSSAKRRIGLIADESPDWVRVSDEKGQPIGISPDAVIMLLVNKVQLLEQRIKALEAIR